MASDSVDFHRLTLSVYRLLDADVVLPAEASALVDEIEATARAPDARIAMPAEESEPLFLMLEAMVRTDRLDGSIGGQAQEIVRRILRGSGG